MAVGTAVSVEEYLKTSYSPDCDYVDGEVVARNLGERQHSTTQREILVFLAGRYPEIRKRIFPEHRVQVSASRYRVPDICVVSETAPYEEIIRTPPDLCIEILSPEDTMSRTLRKIKDYFDMGVPVCWILDPLTHEGWIATPGQMTEAPGGIFRAGEIEMPLAEVLESL